MLQAKAVLGQVVADNQDKVNFMMSQYKQVGSGFDSGYSGAGVRRFQYTSTTAAPILRARGDTADRGFQSWQDIRTNWNQLYYDEQNGATPAACVATVPAQFYQTGADLATALTTAMNAVTCSRGSTPSNTYTVTYNSGTGVFTFSSNLLRSFEMLWDNAANSIRGALGVTWGRTGMGGGPYQSGTPYSLLFMSTTTSNWPGVTGAMGMTRSFSAGTPSVTYYQAGAARLWNGETLQVQADGTICGLTSGPLSSPAEYFVQTVGASCGSNSGTPVTYTFSGAPMTFNTDFCQGFENKVDLLPCDLGDTPSQVSLIGKYLDLEFPFNDDGTAAFYSEDTTDGDLGRPDLAGRGRRGHDHRGRGPGRHPGLRRHPDGELAHRHQGVVRQRVDERPGRRRRQGGRTPLEDHPDQGPHFPQGEDDRHPGDRRKRHLPEPDGGWARGRMPTRASALRTRPSSCTRASAPIPTPRPGWKPT